jgi:C4-dicarboxylate-specific signal transduction histidine kinase
VPVGRGAIKRRPKMSRAASIASVQPSGFAINLVVNGMEAMDSVADRQRELKILSQRDADQVLVAVQDSGVGIDPEAGVRL